MNFVHTFQIPWASIYEEDSWFQLLILESLQNSGCKSSLPLEYLLPTVSMQDILVYQQIHSISSNIELPYRWQTNSFQNIENKHNIVFMNKSEDVEKYSNFKINIIAYTDLKLLTLFLAHTQGLFKICLLTAQMSRYLKHYISTWILFGRFHKC